MAKISISDLLKEARRRRVFRVTAIYVVGTWVLLQVADNAFPAFNIPESAIRYVYFGVFLALPIVIVFGWRYDIVDGRIVRTLKVDEQVPLSLQRPDYVVLASLTVIIAAIVIGLGGEISSTRLPDLDSDSATEVDPASIAVLPFVNMSPDPDNEFFSDGLSEELLNRLATVGGFRVIARTSSFSFKNLNLDIREIGQKLHVAYIVEGSVRVANGRLLVTAQLVNARDGTQQWSQRYESTVTDVFKIQTDISNNIVASLQAVIDIDREADLIPEEPQNIDAYMHLLRGREYARIASMSANPENYVRSIEYFEQALHLDSEYADAFAALAGAHAGLMELHIFNFEFEKSENARDKAEQAIESALALDARSSEAYKALGLIQWHAGNMEEAESAWRQSIAMNPNNARAHHYLTTAIPNERYDESRRAINQALALDPRDPDIVQSYGEFLTYEGKLRQASQYYRLVLDLSGMDRPPPSNLPPVPSNLSFELGTRNWVLENQEEYEFVEASNPLDSEESLGGYIRSLSNDPRWCRLGQAVSARKYLGKFIRLTGRIRTKDLTNAAALWIRVDNAKGPVGFDNMRFNLIDSDTEWTQYEVHSYVPSDSAAILFGAYMLGGGQMWIDNFRLESSDNPDFH